MYDLSLLIPYISYPLFFLAKQVGILAPIFIMLLFIISKFKYKINFKDKKLIFLCVINFAPIILILLTSLFMGVKIRTMWMTPFYLFLGVLFLYVFQSKIILKKIKYFYPIFLILFIFSPVAYFIVSVTQDHKRTDYPGREISQMVEEKWKNNFKNKIAMVAGNEWHGGNLSYHLKSRPKWDNILETKENKKLKNIDGGFILIGSPNILQNICKGVFFKVEKQGICMIGEKK